MFLKMSIEKDPIEMSNKELGSFIGQQGQGLDIIGKFQILHSSLTNTNKAVMCTSQIASS